MHLLKMRLNASIFSLLIIGTISTVSALKSGDCEVCISTLTKFEKKLSEEVHKDPNKIQDAFRQFCLNTKGKINTLCYYLGGLEDSATGILKEMSTPLSWHMPPEKVCERLKKKDAQICDLHFEKQIDVKNVDLKKLRVRDLKKILNDWEESCEGCIEKTDFIKRIEELKSKHVDSDRSEL